MLEIILAIICFLIVLYIDVNTDFKRIEYNTINHKRGLLLRSIGLIPTFFLLFIPNNHYNMWFLLFKTVIILGLIGSFWWEFFDGFLNLKRKKSWRYNGSDDKNDANTDNILQKYTPKQQMLLKWFLIVSFTIIYIKIK